jgi:hypothetical protein
LGLLYYGVQSQADRMASSAQKRGGLFRGITRLFAHS